ncbi:YadA family autotransporter adhesin [Paraburkholderia humisilvae]|uniref:Autotransporter adhesin BpaC n=1 Tax=Paraburkholderia humisilvae TaxID=627669 RepID=A0A6J5F6I0_9BURK|nr:YadA-like family protein [Paraburkholderia humisilvae]CAB3773202.1 Autotransporter adhesin BpaC [Paraburkholderia humisilvae]
MSSLPKSSTLGAVLVALALLLPFGRAYADNYSSGGSNGTNVDSPGEANTGGAYPAVAGSDGTAFNEAFGLNSTANGGEATSMGDGANANGAGATAIGRVANATGDGSAAFGARSVANGLNTTALGDGAQAQASNATAVGRSSIATASDATAFGVGATANIANSVALGTSSVTTAATAVSSIRIGSNTFNFAAQVPVGVVSVGSVGKERQVQNVAAGRITADSTDAINGSQLFATTQAVDNLYIELKAISGNPTGNGSAAGGADATASGTDSSAFGSSALASGSDSSAIGSNAAATGNESTAMGAKAMASGNGSTAIGANSIASGTNSTALGANSRATGNNSVALGAGSVASEANTVSVGAGGSERRITNVANGINPTDAVNMSQLQGVQQSINSIARRAYSGVAGAVALSMIPDVDPGRTVAVGIGSGDFQGYAAVALGVTARVGNNIKVRGGASTSSAGTAWGGGVSYQW